MIEFPPIPEDGRVLFFRRDRPAFGFLSHFHASPIVLDGIDWPTVEHFFQAQKSPDPRYHAAIRACAKPAEAKRLAKAPGPRRRDQDSWFLAHGAQPRADWADVELDLMRRADQAKYAQNLDLAARLLATGDAEIVEDAPHDAFWGVGRDEAGENWAGRILMEVRSDLLARTRGRARADA